MKKSFMSNIKHFVDSNVRYRIDRVANNNSDFFDDDLLLVERQFEDIRQTCVAAEKRISAMLHSLNSPTPLGAYTQNVQASLNNLSGITTTNTTITTNCTATASQNLDIVDQSINSKYNTKPSTFEPSTFCSTTTQSKKQPLAGATLASMTSAKPASVIQGTSTDYIDDELRHEIRRHKKLPIVGFLKFLVKSCHKLKPDSLLATTFTHCSQLQSELTKLYLNYEQTIEVQCLKPLQQVLEFDVPNVIKLRKLFIKSHNDLESVKAKYNGASQKQQSQQATHFTSTSYTVSQSNANQTHINKLDQLKKELDDAVTRFEQARDTYATELYAFVCRETELVDLFMKFYQYQSDYQQHVGLTIQNSLPTLRNTLANTPRKVVFGTSLEEHLRCTGRSTSLVIELCIHLLYSRALNEEGLFRIPGSSAKIKKLKNAINAWFVTLASQSDLENSHHVQIQSSVLAIHELFKDIVGQGSLLQSTIVGGESISGNQIAAAATAATPAGGLDDTTLTQVTNSPTATPTSVQESQHIVFDVHTIAGLLKLYLRELPEPLFTYALYNKWIDATVKTLNNDSQTLALEQVIKQLPKSNYDNLHLLMRFLHLLTSHQESNKMTSTNLAITMAPSLIRARPVEQPTNEQIGSGGDHQQQQLDDIQALNMQMSSVGMSASLHALVIENLINQAEKLFPDHVQFTIPGLNDASEESCDRSKLHQVKLGRSIKSTSPTGLSTASSSSFSSNGSMSSSTCKKHQRKGGSMEGLLGGKNAITTGVSSSRPNSIYIQNNQQPSKSQPNQPPPIPPAPTYRSHSRLANDSTSSFQMNNSQSAGSTSQKPPAPPVPPLCTLKRQQKVSSSPARNSPNEQQLSEDTITTKCNNQTNEQAANVNPKPTVGSLRGTGSLRPSVPPPSRPCKQIGSEGSLMNGIDNTTDTLKSGGDVADVVGQPTDGKSSQAEFEDIQAHDVEEIDISVPISPVVSLDSNSVSNEDDSSFDDSRSLDNSWTESSQQQASNPSLVCSESTIDLEQKENSKPAPMPRKKDLVEKNQESVKELEQKEEEDGGTLKYVPAKPPRIMSPKVTQSTPL